MKQKLLNLLLGLVAITALAAGNTNNVQVQFYLDDTQQEQLKFLKRYFGSTNSLKNFSSNVCLAVVWTPEAQAALSMRRDRVWQAMGTNLDSNIKQLENTLNLPDLVSPFMYP